MLAQTDMVGLAAVIAAVFSGIAAVLGAWNHRAVRDVRAQVDTNGDPRTMGDMMTDVARQTNTDRREGEAGDTP